jgi:broad specificity phosphatase PhoE
MTGLGIRRILTSDLKRSVETARALAEMDGLDLIERKELRERTFGELEGSHYTVLRAWFDDQARLQRLPEHKLRPPGGESLADVWKRLEPIARDLFRSREDTAIFSHGGSCGLLMARLLKAPIEVSRSFRFSNCAITELKRRPDDIFQLMRVNCKGHLCGISDGE